MKKTNKGFTLVELIIVIAILAIIMLIAIPNFSGIQQRMQVRADKATAAQIGKAVRVWFTDYTTDSTLSGEGTVIPSDLQVPSGTNTVDSKEYGTLKGIGEYITAGNRAKSLKDADGKSFVDAGTLPATTDDTVGGYYTVFLTADSTNTAAKIAVAIVGATEGVLATTNIQGIDSVSEGVATVKVAYDGKLSSTSNGGVAYIEP